MTPTDLIIRRIYRDVHPVVDRTAQEHFENLSRDITETLEEPGPGDNQDAEWHNLYHPAALHRFFDRLSTLAEDASRGWADILYSNLHDHHRRNS